MPEPLPEVEEGGVWTAWLDPVAGREQGGRRPVVILANDDYLDLVETLVVVLPVTSVDRGWDNHVALRGLTDRTGWVMTEQIRTLSRDRLVQHHGRVSASCLQEIRSWVRDFLMGPP